MIPIYINFGMFQTCVTKVTLKMTVPINTIQLIKLDCHPTIILPRDLTYNRGIK